MLHCGRNWQPSRVERLIETFKTSTRVAKVSTDIGIGFLKGIGNPAGLDSLISEVVCGELARWFGLTTPDFAIVPLRELEIIVDGRGRLESGPTFVSRGMNGLVSDGSTSLLEKLSNKQDLSRLVVFDTWVRNVDRHHPDPNMDLINRDNLFFRPIGTKFELVVFDHTHCFSDAGLDEHVLRDPTVIRDEQIYGLFPEFQDFLSSASLQGAVDRLRQIDINTLETIVRSVPREWGLSASCSAALTACLHDRAKWVAEVVSGSMIENPTLGLGA